ncbi:MAG: LemA family protein [Clostridia bacterium]|nr:LemA family protein [Clostridia bacterium]
MVIAVVAVVAIVIGIVVWWFKTYNKLVSATQKVKNQWSQIDVQLKKRYDLIPNLVETVKGYAKHEKETLENVVMWRSRATGDATTEDAIEANKGLGQAVSRLLVACENYPDLKANSNFQSLQNDLKDVENKISSARQFYNDTVQKNNELIEKFPSSIVAHKHPSKFKIEKYFEAEEYTREAPKVSF